MTKQEQENYEFIQRYLQKELSPEEVRHFEHRMKQDPEFFKEVQAHMEVQALMIDQGLIEIKKKLRMVHEMESGGKSNFWKYISGAALIIVGASLIFIYTFSGKDDKQKPSAVVIAKSTEGMDSDIVNDRSLQEEKSDEKIKEESKEPSLPQGKKTSNDNRINSSDTISLPGNRPMEVPLKQDDKKIHFKDTSSAATQKHGTDVKFDCSQISIVGDVKVTESCEDKPTGSIIINLSSLKGGKKPYRFSVSEEEGFTMSSQLSDLLPGYYKVLVKDGNECVQVLKEAMVKSKKCPLDLSFYPERESWKIPVKANADAEIKIINSRTGTLVYSSAIHGGYPDSWNGTDNNAGALPMGSYSFIITYSDGEITQGNVSILR